MMTGKNMNEDENDGERLTDAEWNTSNINNIFKEVSNARQKKNNGYGCFFTIVTVLGMMLLMIMTFTTHLPHALSLVKNDKDERSQLQQQRRLSLDSELNNEEIGPITAALHKAQNLKKEKDNNNDDPLRVLYVVTTLSEYDTGTRGTTANSDRLAKVVLPVLTTGIESMINRGWQVDLYLILGYKELKPERRQMIMDALPDGVGLEVWEDAMPLYYKRKKMAQRDPEPDQVLEVASHGLSRQHRFVIKDKLYEYDFFACFEDDMRITSDHMMNFLELSSQIESLIHTAETKSTDKKAHVTNESNRDPSTREKPKDNASVGNDVVDDPLSVDELKRVIPGFIRVEVLDDRIDNHQLIKGGALGNFKFKNQVPTHSDYGSSSTSASNMIDPNACCAEEEPGRGAMKPNPQSNDIIIWETNIAASGVRKYPDPLGWMGVMPVQDIADVGSYWSGYGGDIFGNDVKTRPRRVDQTLGQQAGFMATRSQILFFDDICPGSFLPPFDDEQQWKGDSLQRHAVEFWSGGFQLFGQCLLNRVLSLDPKRFEKQLLYHTANNKQRTKMPHLFVRANDFLGQLYTVKERAEKLVGIQTN